MISAWLSGRLMPVRQELMPDGSLGRLSAVAGSVCAGSGAAAASPDRTRQRVFA
jgi:hypothetical protein